jgi:SsrA-binding protein
MKIIASNKKAYHLYDILDTLEAGIMLTGNEVKALRTGRSSLDESFALIQGGELVLLNCYIAPYSHAYLKNDDTSRRTRKLLVHKREIMRLVGEISRKGLTLIPLKLYFNERGYIKVEIGVARHKQAHSKKRELQERDIKRSVQREIKHRLR